MGDIDLAVSHSKRLERLLEEKLGATGKGLHEKVSSVEGQLPHDLVRQIRLVATVRNKVVHEDDYKRIADRDAFLHASKESERQLKAIGGGSGRGKRVLAVGLAVVVLLILAAVVYSRLRHA